MPPKPKQQKSAEPPSKWPRLAAIAATVAAVAAFLTNVDKIGKTLVEWFAEKKSPAQPTVIVQITPETLLKAAAEATSVTTKAAGPAKYEAEQAQDNLRVAASQLLAPITVSSDQKAIPKWLAIAFSEVGQAELPGDQHNQRIVDYLRSTGLADSQGGDEIPWNAAFANWAMTQSGTKGPSTGSATARAWLNWGNKIDIPRLGAIAVFQRENSPHGGGSVCFFVAETPDQVLCVGGNFLNSVRLMALSKRNLVGYRWPADA